MSLWSGDGFFRFIIVEYEMENITTKQMVWVLINYQHLDHFVKWKYLFPVHSSSIFWLLWLWYAHRFVYGDDGAVYTWIISVPPDNALLSQLCLWWYEQTCIHFWWCFCQHIEGGLLVLICTKNVNGCTCESSNFVPFWYWNHCFLLQICSIHISC